ncbi:NAD(P)-binding protein [Gracilibacillus sp. YIM 98692]|uniref:NAD(P)-binding protein n=1 Tax=Gracilibacillus sp. YIM 98692 TaxID=2663532 RepID=UPI0013D74835|nr:NAD(P)-binding protein [Gracilibacillus sp. YIM 98692]
MTKIPLMIDLIHRKIVVFGGGTVAERRVTTLLPYTTNITIISPTVTDLLKELAIKHRIHWIQRDGKLTDIESYNLIIIASNDPTFNQMIAEHAPTSCLMNATFHADYGNIDFPIFLDRGKLKIAISTNGASPILAKRIKKQLEDQFPVDYEGYIDFLYDVRQLVKKTNWDQERKRNLLNEIIDHPIYDENDQINFLEKLKKQM